MKAYASALLAGRLAKKKGIKEFVLDMGLYAPVKNSIPFAAQKGAAHMGAYAAAKSAVIRLTESMAAELREKNVNVNCVLPTIIDTPENRAAMPAADPGRWVAPADLASVILFLASDAARYITGAVIYVDGGYTADGTPRLPDLSLKPLDPANLFPERIDGWNPLVLFPPLDSQQSYSFPIDNPWQWIIICINKFIK